MCQNCVADQLMLSEITSSILKIMSLSLACREVSLRGMNVDQRREFQQQQVQKWLDEMRSEGVLTAQQTALRLTQKFVAWANGYLAGVTLEVSGN